MKRYIIPFCFGIAIVLLLCSACSPGNEATEAEVGQAEPTNTAIPPTETDVPSTDTPTPTSTATPTNTPIPTDTPIPTNTPVPTDTPTPTPTKTPTPTPTPTPLPEPIVLTGTGDSLVDIEKGEWVALVHIIGNSAGGHFAVKNYDANDQDIDLLVNTTDPYDGVRPLDFLVGEHTYGFDVTATGDWTIEVIPLPLIEKVSASESIEGVGDFVFAIQGEPRRATITGNAGSSHFAVKAYSSSSIDLLVNTTDPYNGEVRLEPGVAIIEVIAVGDWSISFEE